MVNPDPVAFDSWSALVPTFVLAASPDKPVTVSGLSRPVVVKLLLKAALVYVLVVVAPVTIKAAGVTVNAPLL